MITLGKTADIKSMMMELNKRKSFVDLKFVCEDGDLYAHKFIIGAQSKYLRKLMANDQSDEEITIFHLPDIQSKILKIVLKFLYTGRLLIFRGQVAVVKELLENVLHIDAKITLPETASLARPSSSRNRDDDDENDGGANNRSKKRHRPGSPSSNGGSKKSKKSSSDRSLNTPSPPHGNRHGPLDLDAAPPSPPYSLHGGDDDDDDVDRDCGGGPSDVDDPDVVDVDDDKSDDDVKFEGEKSREWILILVNRAKKF